MSELEKSNRYLTKLVLTSHNIPHGLDIGKHLEREYNLKGYPESVLVYDVWNTEILGDTLKECNSEALKVLEEFSFNLYESVMKEKERRNSSQEAHEDA